MNGTEQLNEANKIIDSLIALLDVKARKGCYDKNTSWVGVQNGNGVEIGVGIEKLIVKAKKYTKKYNKQ